MIVSFFFKQKYCSLVKEVLACMFSGKISRIFITFEEFLSTVFMVVSTQVHVGTGV